MFLYYRNSHNKLFREINHTTPWSTHTGNAEGLFFVDSSSGLLTTRASLLDAPDTLTLTVTAFDHGTPTHSASIPVTVFISPPLASSVSTPSLQVLSVAVAEDVAQDTVVATLDPSPAALATAYVIVSGNYEASFDVSLQADGTGQLRVVKALDYEVYRAFELLVNVETAGGGDIQRLVLVRASALSVSVLSLIHISEPTRRA